MPKLRSDWNNEDMTFMSLKRQRHLYFNKKTKDDKGEGKQQRTRDFREWALFSASEELVFTAFQNYLQLQNYAEATASGEGLLEGMRASYARTIG